jgi:hypothetical protein
MVIAHFRQLWSECRMLAGFARGAVRELARFAPLGQVERLVIDFADALLDETYWRPRTPASVRLGRL